LWRHYDRAVRSLAITMLACCVALVPATAAATVTATSELSSTGVSVTVLSDDAPDEFTVSCGLDGNVKVDDLDPTTPAACSEVTALTVDGGAGDDLIDLTAVTHAAGFTALCGPCPRGGYAIVAECLAGAGEDVIRSSWIGTLIGGCAGMESMTGNDIVATYGGDDAVAAGPGSDRIHGGPGDDQLFGGPGTDFIRAGKGDDVLAGKQGDDFMSGAAGDDRLAGGPGFDGLRGGAGSDICVGGPDRATADGCESIRGVERLLALGFAPRS
jgi:Ca2+-binding RTX toxin-like protein